MITKDDMIALATEQKADQLISYADAVAYVSDMVPNELFDQLIKDGSIKGIFSVLKDMAGNVIVSDSMKFSLHALSLWKDTYKDAFATLNYFKERYNEE